MKTFSKLESSANATQGGDRPIRFESHALVEMRLSKWNPFSNISAVLLDLSTSGFKVEFVSPVSITPGQPLSIAIPLAPFNILVPNKLKMQVTVKWFDEKALKAGGVFMHLTSEQRYFLDRILSQIIDSTRQTPLASGME